MPSCLHSLSQWQQNSHKKHYLRQIRISRIACLQSEVYGRGLSLSGRAGRACKINLAPQLSGVDICRPAEQNQCEHVIYQLRTESLCCMGRELAIYICRCSCCKRGTSRRAQASKLSGKFPMSSRAVYSSFSTVAVPCVRTGRRASCTCSAKKKGKRPKSKRGLKRQDASRERPAPSERTLERQDAFSERNFASVQPPDITERAGPTQHKPMPKRQDAVNGGTRKRQDDTNEGILKTVKSADNVSQQGSPQRLERENVLTVCRVTSIGMAVIGVLATFVTPTLLEKAGSGIHSISQDTLLHLPSVMDIGIAVAAGCCVTAARFAAMQSWEDLAVSTNAANSQV